MTDQLELIHGLLQDQREAQHRANAMLGDLRVDVAAMQRLQESQSVNLAEIRADIRQIYDRLRDAEMKMQQIPAVEAELARQAERMAGIERANQRRQDDLERRMRALEGDGREHKVVAGALATGARTIWHYIAGAVVAAVIAAIVASARDPSARQLVTRQGTQSFGEPAGR